MPPCVSAVIGLIQSALVHVGAFVFMPFAQHCLCVLLRPTRLLLSLLLGSLDLSPSHPLFLFSLFPSKKYSQGRFDHVPSNLELF